MTASLLVVTLVAQVWANEVRVTPTPAPDPYARVPSPVIERVVSEGERRSRLSLFDNGVAVVAVAEDGREVLFRDVALERAELAAYLMAIARDVEQVEGSAKPTMGEHLAQGVIRIFGEDGRAREVRYASGVMLELPFARLVATLDDLEKRVAESPPFEDEVRSWQPQRGDVVELFGGELAEVRDVNPEQGMIWVAYRHGAMVEMIPMSERVRRVLRVVSD